MKRSLAIVALCSLAAGCASTASKGGKAAQPAREVRLPSSTNLTVRAESGPPAKRLSQAVELLRRGESSAAARMLASIANGPKVPGVSDEALFRLALLSLRRGSERVPGHGLQLLRRLKREYPASPWTAQAAPLVEVLGAVDELRRQNRSLAAGNQALATEREELRRRVDELDGKVKQLNNNLEQLRRLDMELEQKVR